MISEGCCVSVSILDEMKNSRIDSFYRMLFYFLSINKCERHFIFRANIQKSTHVIQSNSSVSSCKK